MNKTNTTYRATIRDRKSCRSFNQEYLTPADKKELVDFIAALADSNLFVLEKGEGEKKMTLDYGVIKGHNTYILGIVKHSPTARLFYGYHMEKVVLKATEMGLGTCWIGYFDHDYFNDLDIKEGYKIPGVVVIGYPLDIVTLPQRFLRFTANASKRLPWEKLFFDYTTKAPLSSPTSFAHSADTSHTSAAGSSHTSEAHSSPTSASSSKIQGQYAESLEMVRLAPSSSNSQPWRVYFDEPAQEFHFFKKPKNRIYESMGMHELDLGIAMAHFEVTSLENGLAGSWIIHPETNENKNKVELVKQQNIPFVDDLQYIISWKCK